MTINWVPDAIPLSLFNYLSIWLNLLCCKSNIPITEENENENYFTIKGYSCRSLFEIWLRNMSKDETEYAITPIHHTSWRNIIEQYIPSKNITVLELNEKMSKIEFNSIDESKLEKIKVVIITHLFGLDFNLDELVSLKEKYNWLIVEDRVQGGTVDNAFSNPVVDISFYSMGMDKRPCALGGGYVNVRSNLTKIKDDIISGVESLPLETRWERFYEMVKKIPTYALYNYRIVYRTVSYFLPWFGCNLNTAIQSYREKNPGFSHTGYLKKPSQSLLFSMNQNKTNYRAIEERLRNKYAYFHGFLKLEYIPWVNYDRIINNRSAASLTMYNTIFIKPKDRYEILDSLRAFKLAYIPNPTWKVLRIADPKYQTFCDNLVYLPCLYNMNKKEMHLLSCIVNGDFSHFNKII